MTSRANIASIWLLVALSPFGCAHAGADFVKKVQAELVQIELLDADLAPIENQCGVGLYLGGDRLLTARHVAVPVIQFQFFRFTRPSYEPKTIKTSEVRRLLPDSSSHWSRYDIAIIDLAPNAFVGPGIQALAASDVEDLYQLSNVAIVSWRAGQCRADQDAISAIGPTVRTATISAPSRWVGPEQERIVLSQAESAGYSGSPLISFELNKIIGIYIGANPEDPSEGYASSLWHVQDMFERADVKVVRGRLLARHFGISLGLGHFLTEAAARIESSLAASVSISTFLFDLRKWIIVFIPTVMADVEVGLREKVVDAYPGTEAQSFTVPHNSIGLYGSMTFRFEVAPFLAFNVDPILVGPRFVLAQDRQTVLSWKSQANVAVRFFPWPLTGTENVSAWLKIGVAQEFAPIKVLDYQFDLSGAPRDQEHEVTRSPTTIQFAVEIML